MKKKSSGAGVLSPVTNFFREFGEAVAKGDIFVKLSLIWWGAGYLDGSSTLRRLL